MTTQDHPVQPTAFVALTEGALMVLIEELSGQIKDAIGFAPTARIVEMAAELARYSRALDDNFPTRIDPFDIPNFVGNTVFNEDGVALKANGHPKWNDPGDENDWTGLGQ
jgi:hypothetical protein